MAASATQQLVWNAATSGATQEYLQTKVTTTQSHPLAKWNEVITLWREANDWTAAPTMSERHDIAAKVSTHVSFVTRVVGRVLGGGEVGPKDRGGSQYLKMTDDAVAFVKGLWEQDVQLETWEYKRALLNVGIDVAESTINNVLNDVLKLPIKKPYEIRAGKFTAENWHNLRTYLDIIDCVDPYYLRFFDEVQP